jgi:type I restriction enzyme S subunit
MSFPRYPKYKDSGVEWLGPVPEHWGVSQIKRIATIRYGIGEPPQYYDDGTPLIRATNVHGGKLFSDGMVFVDPNEISEQRIVWLEGGDIIVVRSGAYTGDSAIIPSGFGSCIAGFDMVLKCHAARPEFIQFSLLSKYLREGQIDLARMRAAQPHLNAEELGSCLVALPSDQEQDRIAAFLDRETAKIDALVGEQQRLIELLKEKRKAVISHAVTKGLNPQARMRASGVEWLGEVPAHWEVTPLKYVVSLRSGGTPNKSILEYWDGSVPWASSKDLKVEELSDTEDHITQKAIEEGAADLVPEDSLLIVVRGMILAHSFPVVKSRVQMAINQDLKAIRPCDKLDVDFLGWLLRGALQETLGRTDEAAHGTKVLRLDAWTSMPLPIPPLGEQRAIVSWVVDGMKRLDALAAEVEQSTCLLQERRTALISAASTGQIDVCPLEGKQSA